MPASEHLHLSKLLWLRMVLSIPKGFVDRTMRSDSIGGGEVSAKKRFKNRGVSHEPFVYRADDHQIVERSYRGEFVGNYQLRPLNRPRDEWNAEIGAKRSHVFHPDAFERAFAGWRGADDPIGLHQQP